MNTQHSSYYIEIDRGAFRANGSGSEFVGISDRNKWNFTIGSPAELNFGELNYSIREDGSTISTIEVTRRGELNRTVSGSISLTASVEDTARPGEDYITTPIIFSMEPGETSRAILLSSLILNDVLPENNETLLLTLNGENGAVVGASNKARLTIADDDGVLNFDRSSFSFWENGTPISEIVVTRQGALSNTIYGSISLMNTTGDTATQDQDYRNTPISFAFAPNETRKVISLPSTILNDALLENTEFFTLTLNREGNIIVGESGTAKLSIIDDDVELNFESSTFSFREDGTTPTGIVVTRRGRLDNRVLGSINLTTTAQDFATQSRDYAVNFIPFALEPGETRRVISITSAIVNDNLPEIDETLTLTLSGEGGATVGAKNTARLTIVDDDAELNFTRSSYRIGEGGTLTESIIVTRRGGLSNTVNGSIRLVTIAGDTATQGQDYLIYPINFTFAPNETSKIIALDSAINNDTLPEAHEILTLALEPGNGSVTGQSSTAKLTIVDNDVEFNFSNSSYRIREDGTSIDSVVVTRRGGLSDTVSGTISLMSLAGDTATALQDYNTAPIPFTFAPNETRKTISIARAIVRDTLVENNETLTLVLSGGSGATVGTLATAQLTVEDDDAQIRFKDTSYKVVEGNSGMIGSTITLTRVGRMSGSISVRVTPVRWNGANAATPNTDYQLNSRTITFADGDTSDQVVSIAGWISNDRLAESVEWLALRVEVISGVATAGPNAALEIIDNDFIGSPGSDTLTGTDYDDYLAGGGGNDDLRGGHRHDVIEGQNGDDRLRGGTGNDVLWGQLGNDVLVGAGLTTTPGRGEIDRLVGGPGRDLFVLGNRGSHYYDDGNRTSSGVQDYALIEDFSRIDRDVIQLRGAAGAYRLGTVAVNSPAGRVSGLGIYLRNGANQDELIGVLKDFTGNLSLTSSHFLYI